MQLKAVDFFCGAGGMSYGFYKAGISVIGGIDNDSDCGDTYVNNIPGAKFIEADIAALKYNSLVEEFGVYPNDDSLIFIGCSPCQFWSKVKTSRDINKQGAHLLQYFEHFVEFFRPAFIVIENVPGLLTKKKESLLPNFQFFLQKNGYSYKADVVNSRFYGVPQNRFRFLMIASRISAEIGLPIGCIDNSLTVRQFIGNLSEFPKISAGEVHQSLPLHRASALSEKNLKRIKRTTPNGGNRFDWKNSPDLQIRAYENKDDCFRNVYGRMYWDRPAPTITTRFNSFSNGRFGHPEQDRAISILEGSRLQTFPINYIFRFKNQESITRQIGNAVPPAMSKRIGRYLLKISNG